MKKQVLLITGDKGGVGKSFFSRLLTDYFKTKGVKFNAYDTDSTNSTLFRFYGDLTYQLNIEDTTELDELLTTISNAKGDLIVDCGARVLDRLVTWMDQVDFLSLQEELNFEVTLVFVLGPEKDCVQILRDVVDRFNANVQYVIVRNLGKGRSFGIYDGSQTRKRLVEELDATELDLPALFENTTLFLDKNNLGFTDALTSSNTSIADRQRIKKFRDEAFSSFRVFDNDLSKSPRARSTKPANIMAGRSQTAAEAT